MQYKRSKRVGELVLQEISKMLLFREIKDPRIGFLTVTHIELTDDLRNAKVYVSLMGTDEEKNSTLEGLSCATGFIRRLLGKRMQIKRIPAIHFVKDSSIDHSIHINSILNELRDELPESEGIEVN